MTESTVPQKRRLSAADILPFHSPYLNGGRRQESWEIVDAEIDGNRMHANVRMSSLYASPTDKGGFHLTVFSTLEFLSQLLTVYIHIWADIPQKTREGWMIDCSISSTAVVRDPENIRVDMEITSIKRVNGRVLAAMRARVFDDSGAFDVTMKGFLG